MSPRTITICLPTVLAAIAGLPSCASMGTPRGEAPPFQVHAPSPGLRQRGCEIVGELLPKIARAFGSSPKESVSVTLAPDDRPSAARRAHAVASRRGIIIFDTSDEEIVGHIAHELVHTMVRYRPSRWGTLPIVLEEGICTLIGYGCNGVEEVLIEGVIPPAVLEHYLGLGIADLQALEVEETKVAYHVASYAVGLLGLDRIELLCLRASGANHETIPVPWLLEELRQAEQARASGSRSDAGFRLDPLFGRIEVDVEEGRTATITADFSTP